MKWFASLLFFVSLRAPAAEGWRVIRELDQFGIAATPADDSPRFRELTRFIDHSRKGGTLKVSWFEPILSVFPTAIRNGDFRPRAPLAPDYTYEYLMTNDPRRDDHTVYPLATREILARPDFCGLRVTLRDDVRFSDGTPVTAESVRFSLDRYLNEFFTGALAALVHRTAGRMDLEVIDAATFEVTFNEIAPTGCRQAAFYFLSGVPLIRPNPDARVGERVDMPYIGSGPYAVTTREPNLLRLRRRADYWGRDLEIRAKVFNPDVIEAHVYLDPMVERLAFIRGDLSVFRENRFSYDDWMKHEQSRRGFKRVEQSSADNGEASGAVWMNQLHEHTGRLEFRRALLLVWDLESANFAFFANRRHAAVAPGAESRLYPKGAPSPEVLALLERGAQDPAFASARRDMEDTDFARAARVKSGRDRLRAALNILKDAGYEYGRIRGSTRLTKNGKPVVLTALSRLGSSEGGLLLRLRGDLAKIGIELVIREMNDRSALVTALQNNQYDLLASSVSIARQYEVLDTAWLIAELHSTSVKTLGAWGRLLSPMIDATLDEMERRTPLHPDFSIAAEAFIRAFTANVAVLPSGEVDPVFTYHQAPLHVWSQRARDLWTAYF